MQLPLAPDIVAPGLGDSCIFLPVTSSYSPGGVGGLLSLSPPFGNTIEGDPLGMSELTGVGIKLGMCSGEVTGTTLGAAYVLSGYI